MKEMKRKAYETISLTVVTLEANDVVRTSVGNDGFTSETDLFN